MYIVYSADTPARIQHTYRLHKYAVYSICTCTGNIALVQVVWDQGDRITWNSEQVKQQDPRLTLSRTEPGIFMYWIFIY